MKRQIRRFLCGTALILAPSLALPLAALTDLGPVAAKVRSQVVTPPTEVLLITLDKTDRGFNRQEYVLHRTEVPGGYRVEAEGSFTVRRDFRSDGRLLSLEETDTATGVSVQQTVTGGREVRTQRWEKRRLLSDKTITLSSELVLASELDTVLAQAWGAGFRDGLRFKSVSPDGGLVADFQVVFVETRQPMGLSSKYAYPDEFRMALPADSYVVADMSLTGAGALFIPHHYYLIFLKEPAGLRFVAYYGENPKTARFQFTRR